MNSSQCAIRAAASIFVAGGVRDARSAMFSAIVPSNRKLSCSTTPRCWPGSRAGGRSPGRARRRARGPASGRLNAITRLDERALARAARAHERRGRAGRARGTSTSLAAPACRRCTRSSRRRTRRRRARRPAAARAASSSSSVAIERISRMRSSPANASLICVPIEAICTSGAATRPVKNRYMTKSPSVIVPGEDRAAADDDHRARRCAPTTTVENAVMADTPVIDLATLRNSGARPARTPAPRASRPCRP